MVSSMEHTLIKQRTQRIVEARLNKLRVGRKPKLIVKQESGERLLSSVWNFEGTSNAESLPAILDDNVGDVSHVDERTGKSKKRKSGTEKVSKLSKMKERNNAMKRKKRHGKI